VRRIAARKNQRQIPTATLVTFSLNLPSESRRAESCKSRSMKSLLTMNSPPKPLESEMDVLAAHSVTRLALRLMKGHGDKSLPQNLQRDADNTRTRRVFIVAQNRNSNHLGHQKELNLRWVARLKNVLFAVLVVAFGLYHGFLVLPEIDEVVFHKDINDQAEAQR